MTNFDMSRYDVNSILESSTLPIGGAAKRLKDAEQAEMTIDGQRTDDEMSSQLTDGINNYGAGHHHGWPTVAFQQAHQPFSMHYPYGGHQQRAVWCKQEQDTDTTATTTTHSFQDLHHQLQLGNTHNFFQPNVLHNLMSMDSSSMEHSSGSNSVIYSGGGAAAADGGSAATGGGVCYGSSNIGFVMPISTVIAHEGGSHGHGNVGFGDSEVKAMGYDNMFGSTDPYHARSLYYLSQQSSTGMVKGSSSSSYDQGSGCNNWVPTAVPTLAPRTNSMAVCHGTPTFTVWNDT